MSESTIYRVADEMVDVVTIPAYIFDTTSLFLIAVNRPFCDLLGYSARELLSMTIEQIAAAPGTMHLRTSLEAEPARGVGEWRLKTRSKRLVTVRTRYRNMILVSDGRRIEARFTAVESTDEIPTSPIVTGHQHQARCAGQGLLVAD